MFNLIKFFMHNDWSSFDAVKGFDTLRDIEGSWVAPIVICVLALIFGGIFAAVIAAVAWTVNIFISAAVSRRAFDTCRKYQTERLGI